jgi:aubergine-like protein
MEPVNPESGTVVLDELSVDERYDFHLCAQNVRQGSCTPVHLVVAHNTSKMSQEELIQLTYDQCFNYYNWGGAVKVPGALQCANKVAKLASQHIRRDVASGPLTTTYYYL